MSVGAFIFSRSATLLAKIRARLGRTPQRSQSEDDLFYLMRSKMFDREWYLERYPDVAASGISPVEHYVLHGTAEGRDPCRLFDTKFYTEKNPDVAASGINPFRHFCEIGWREGRDPSGAISLKQHASELTALSDVYSLFQQIEAQQVGPGGGEPDSLREDAEIYRASGLFDETFYLSRNTDVASAGLGPFDHFVEYGAREARDPCALFDSNYYLLSNPDVARAGVPPFKHFCLHGWRELRNPSASFDLGRYWLEHMAPYGSEGNPLAHYVSTGRRLGHQPMPVGGIGVVESTFLLGQAKAIVGGNEQASSTSLEMLGQAFMVFSKWEDAEAVFRRLLGDSWDSARLHCRLALALEKQGKWWQAAESLEVAISLEDRHAEWHLRLGDAHARMNRYELAVKAFQRALTLSPDDANLHYRLGCALEALGQSVSAASAYESAVALDGRQDVARFGVGYLHQARGEWSKAAAAYGARVERSPLDATLRYRLGMALDRCYRWSEAQVAFETAIALAPNNPYWYYRLGFVLERQKQWSAAAEAYAASVLLSEKFVPYWSYRQGYVLQQAERHKEAIEAYLATQRIQTVSGQKVVPCSGDSRCPSELAARAHAHDQYITRFSRPKVVEESLDGRYLDGSDYYALGVQFEMRGDWDRAAECYTHAVARSDEVEPRWNYRLGYVLYRAGSYREAAEAFRDMRALGAAYGVNLHALGSEERLLAEYVEHTRRPIMRNFILYESYHGAAAGGNPFAIFMHVLDRREFNGWTHVWAVTNEGVVPPALRARSNVVVITRNSSAYRRYLARASHLVSDVTFPSWFIRRPEQKYLNTWHGTPLKGLGKHIPGEFLAHANTARNFLQATHIISPNPHTTKVIIDAYDLGGVLDAKLAETGQPRVDRTLSATPQERDMLRKRLGLRDDLPVVLYAPTWRGKHGSAEIDVIRLKDDISQIARHPCQLVFRGHHLLESALADLKLSVAVAPQAIDTSELLAIVDVLITDYSSILFDFLPLLRPIIYYAYDLKEYLAERSIYFDMERLPGAVCYSLSELLAELPNALRAEGRKDSFQAALEEFCPHEDGCATQRAVEFFFHDESTHVVSTTNENQRTLAFYEGQFLPNGITSSFLNLMRAMRSGSERLVVLTDPAHISKNEDRMRKFNELPEEVQVLGRTGSMVLDPEERWVLRRFNAQRGLGAAEKITVLSGAYKREYMRMFGGARFDTVVHFEGYSTFWMKLLSQAPAGTRRVTYLHNDMVAEYKVRLPYLEGLFPLYRSFDSLVSVSLRMSDVNRDGLSAQFNISPDKFIAVNNSVDFEGIRRKAQEAVDEDLAPWLDETVSFVTLGRMSPEKDHAKLIDAFAQVYKIHPNARLIILGDGPLRKALEIKIGELGLEAVVLLAGLRANPFPVLARCDCFVLSSNHEGQPMVLLEALTLNKPIIATDIDGNRALLEDGYGVLVENSVSGLAMAMSRYCAGEMTGSRVFDEAAYQREALSMFRAACLPDTVNKRALFRS